MLAGKGACAAHHRIDVTARKSAVTMLFIKGVHVEIDGAVDFISKASFKESLNEGDLLDDMSCGTWLYLRG